MTFLSETWAKSSDRLLFLGAQSTFGLLFLGIFWKSSIFWAIFHFIYFVKLSFLNTLFWANQEASHVFLKEKQYLVQQPHSFLFNLDFHIGYTHLGNGHDWIYAFSLFSVGCNQKRTGNSIYMMFFQVSTKFNVFIYKFKSVWVH